ncbi:hypothetical protein POM88_025645 [Heracleum sosnowskyi]|uniref:Lactate/malate dehydrogenase C-terminal domain-containing protein n=1 Tax=Heracleum sosnowskyi TaxID=360622 RepID=A0AAD8MMR5_9APIA|nr:hypothetical protein POM88_025645 [Heracleum sosnowskyi]
MVLHLALKAGVFYDKVSNVTIWGNHFTTQVPDFLNAKIDGLPVKEVIKDTKWLEEDFTQMVQTRGGVLIKKWGRSSAASTAVSIVDGIRSLVTPTPEGDWFSTGVYTTRNPYGIDDDIVFSMPCRSKGDGDYELVKDIIFDDYLFERIQKSKTIQPSIPVTKNFGSEGIENQKAKQLLLGKVEEVVDQTNLSSACGCPRLFHLYNSMVTPDRSVLICIRFIYHASKI